MKKIGAFFILAVFSILTINGCNTKTAIDSPKNETVDKEVKPIKDMGPAGKTIQMFFKNWEFKRYKQMHAQTVNSRNEDVFIEHMEITPIKYTEMVILSEEPSGDDWDVTVSMKVTDVTSAFAACILNLRFPPDPESDQPNFRFSPEFLGIQKFARINQVWKVINLDGEYVVDLCASGSERKRHENIMNYVLDAADLNSFPMNLSSLEEDSIPNAASFWLAIVCMDMNIPESDLMNILQRSVPLAKKAEINMKRLINKIESLGRKDKET